MTPHLDPSTGCTTTFADYFGNGYKAYHAIYAILSVALFIVAFLQAYRIVKSKKSFFPIDLQRFLHYVVCVCSVTFVLRSIDPEGWSARSPYWFNALMTETCSSVIYCGTLSLVLSWVKLILKLSGKDRDHHIVRRLRLMKYIVQPSLIFLQNFFTQMGLGVGPTWKWRICLFLTYPIFNSLMLGVGLFYGLTIFSTLAKLSHSTGGPPNSSSPSPTSEDFSETSTAKDSVHSSKDLKIDVGAESKDKDGKDVPSSPSQLNRDIVPVSADSPRNSNPASVFPKKKAEDKPKTKTPKAKEPSNDTKIGMLRRLLFLLALFTTISVIAIILQLLQIPQAASDHDDYHTKPLNPPTSIIGSIYFSILQYIACLVVLFFFRSIQTKKAYQDQSSGGGASAYGPGTSPKNKPQIIKQASNPNPGPIALNATANSSSQPAPTSQPAETSK